MVRKPPSFDKIAGSGRHSTRANISNTAPQINNGINEETTVEEIDEIDLVTDKFNDKIDPELTEETVVIRRASVMPDSIVRPTPKYTLTPVVQTPTLPPPPPPTTPVEGVNTETKHHDTGSQLDSTSSKPWYASWQTWLMLLAGILLAALLSWFLTINSAKNAEAQITGEDADIINVMQDQIDDLNEQLETANSDKTTVDADLQLKNRDLAEANRKIDELTKSNEDLNTQLTDATTAKNQAEVDAASAKTEADNAKAETVAAQTATAVAQAEKEAWKKTATEAIKLLENAGITPPTTPNN